MKACKAVVALLPLALSCVGFAGGEAEWNDGVKSINQLRGEVNRNSSDLRKAGVNVNALNQQLSLAERQLQQARFQMWKANQNLFQNSTSAGILNQYDIFRSSSVFSSDGKLHLIPSAPIIDMGMSNAFSSNGTLVKSSSLYEVAPSIPFRPMLSPEEMLRANSSLGGSSPITPGGGMPSHSPQQSATAGKASSQDFSFGVIDPSVLKAGDPAPPSLKISAPPLPVSAPLPPREPLTTGNYDVISSDGTKISNGYNLLPPELKNPDNVNVSGYGEVDVPGIKGKLSIGTGGVDLEGGGSLEPGKKSMLGMLLENSGSEFGLEGSKGKHWDWSGDSSTFVKTGPSFEIPISPYVDFSAGAGRSWSSKGETVDSIEAGLSKGFKLPLAPKSVKGKAGVNVSLEWKDIDDPDAGKSKLYGPGITK